MRRFALALPLLLLTGCAAAAAPADQQAAAPTSAQATPTASVPTQVADADKAEADKVAAADEYWSSARLDALNRAKGKYPEWKTIKAAGEAAATVAESVKDSTAAAAPVTAPIVQEPAPLEPQPVPTTPPAEAIAAGKISNEDFFLFLRGMIWTVNQDLITVKGLRIVLVDLDANLDLTRKQSRVLRDLLAEVDKVLAKGERAADPNWDSDKLKLPNEIADPLPVKDLELLGK